MKELGIVVSTECEVDKPCLRQQSKSRLGQSRIKLSDRRAWEMWTRRTRHWKPYLSSWGPEHSSKWRGASVPTRSYQSLVNRPWTKNLQVEIVQGISVTRISETVSQSSEFLEEFGVLAVIAFKLQTKLRTISNHKTTTHLRWKRQFIRIWAVSIFHQRTIKWIELDEWPFWLLTKASVDSFGIDLDYAVWKRQSAYPAIKSPVVTRDLGSERVMTKILTELWGWWSFGDSCRCSSKSLMNLSVLPNLVIIQKGCYPPFLIRQKNIWSFSKKILPGWQLCWGYPDGLGKGSRIGRSAGRRCWETGVERSLALERWKECVGIMDVDV